MKGIEKWLSILLAAGLVFAIGATIYGWATAMVPIAGRAMEFTVPDISYVKVNSTTGVVVITVRNTGSIAIESITVTRKGDASPVAITWKGSFPVPTGLEIAGYGELGAPQVGQSYTFIVYVGGGGSSNRKEVTVTATGVVG